MHSILWNDNKGGQKYDYSNHIVGNRGDLRVCAAYRRRGVSHRIRRFDFRSTDRMVDYPVFHEEKEEVSPKHGLISF